MILLLTYLDQMSIRIEIFMNLLKIKDLELSEICYSLLGQILLENIMKIGI